MGTYLKLAWRNMWRNWRRTAIALVAIILGLILLLFFDGFIAGSDQAIFGNAVRLYGGNIQAHDEGFRAKARRLPILPLSDADAVVAAATAQAEVVSAAKRINTGGIISSREGAFPVVITAVQPEIEAQTSIQAENVMEGRFLREGEGDAIFIGRGLAELLDAGVGDRVNLLGRSKHEEMRQRTMTIVGIYNLGMPELEKGTVFMTLAEAQDLYNLRDEVTEVAINLQEVGQEVKVMPALVAALPGYDIDTWDTLRPEVKETLIHQAGLYQRFWIDRDLCGQHRHSQHSVDGRLRTHPRNGCDGRSGHERPPDHESFPVGGHADRRVGCDHRLSAGCAAAGMAGSGRHRLLLCLRVRW